LSIISGVKTLIVAGAVGLAAVTYGGLYLKGRYNTWMSRLEISRPASKTKTVKKGLKIQIDPKSKQDVRDLNKLYKDKEDE